MLNRVEEPGRRREEEEETEDEEGLEEALEGSEVEEVAETADLPLRGREEEEDTFRPRLLTPQREGGRR